MIFVEEGTALRPSPSRPPPYAGGGGMTGSRLPCRLALAPFLQHRLASARIALLGHVEHDDSVGSEVAEVLAQFAPRHDHPHLLEEAQGERPDRALAVGAVVVAIAEPDLALGADGLADLGQLR